MLVTLLFVITVNSFKVIRNAPKPLSTFVYTMNPRSDNEVEVDDVKNSLFNTLKRKREEMQRPLMTILKSVNLLSKQIAKFDEDLLAIDNGNIVVMKENTVDVGVQYNIEDIYEAWTKPTNVKPLIAYDYRPSQNDEILHPQKVLIRSKCPGCGDIMQAHTYDALKNFIEHCILHCDMYRRLDYVVDCGNCKHKLVNYAALVKHRIHCHHDPTGSVTDKGKRPQKNGAAAACMAVSEVHQRKETRARPLSCRNPELVKQQTAIQGPPKATSTEVTLHGMVQEGLLLECSTESPLVIVDAINYPLYCTEATVSIPSKPML